MEYWISPFSLQNLQVEEEVVDVVADRDHEVVAGALAPVG